MADEKEEIKVDDISLDDIKLPGAPKDDKKIDEPAGKKDDAGDGKKVDEPAGKKDDGKKVDEPAGKKDEGKKDDDAGDGKKKDEPAGKKDDEGKKDDDDDDQTEGLVKVKKDGGKKDDDAGDGKKDDDDTQVETDWGALSDDVGLEIESEEEMIESLKELASIKKMSPVVQKVIEIEKNKGDVAAYFKLMADDPDKLPDGEALWRQFSTDPANAKKVSRNENFARTDFERNVKKEFDSLLKFQKMPEGEEKEEFYKANKDDIDYLREKYKADVSAARASLKEARETTKFFEPQTQVTKEDEDKILKDHLDGYQGALKTFKNVEVTVGDDFRYRVALNDANRELVNKWVKEPKLLLEEMGFGEKTINYDKLVGMAVLLADIQVGNFGSKLRDTILSAKDIKALEEDIDDGNSTKRKGAGGGGAADELDEFADAIIKKRQQKGR